MKIVTENIVEVEGITAPVSGTKGLGYETIEAWKGTINWIASTTRLRWLLARGEGDSLTLESRDLP